MSQSYREQTFNLIRINEELQGTIERLKITLAEQAEYHSKAIRLMDEIHVDDMNCIEKIFVIANGNPYKSPDQVGDILAVIFEHSTEYDDGKWSE